LSFLLARHSAAVSFAIWIAWAMPAQSDTPAPPGSALDQCSVIVTGTDMRSRPDGVSRCLLQVLAKVSGDPRLATDPGVRQAANKAEDLVESIAYFDRLSDLPMHDEQGSRDRPFDLVVRFDPAKVDALLASVGHKPWRSTRPALVVAIDVHDQRGGAFPLTADGIFGARQREALFTAGERFGMRIVLLPELGQSDGETERDPLERAKGTIHETPLALLSGRLVWSSADFGWVGTWRLRDGENEVSWEVRGVSFDEAFRNAIGGAAEALSGTGKP
jgi:hypothetical protein